MAMQNVIAIVGPTASGKTDLSIALAKRFGGEIVSADSMQIYREMNIGTAKPSPEEQCGVVHHLMGHVSVEASYNVAAYVRDGNAVLRDLELRGVLPVLCGGTGLYMDHLLQNTIFFEIPRKEEVRRKYQLFEKKHGREALFTLLEQADPRLAASLHPNDVKRVIRGLEVFEITGRRLSDYQKESRRESPYRVLYIGLGYQNRALLYERINRRVDLMMEHGLESEVRALLSDFTLSPTARAAIGYKELIDAISRGERIEDAVALIKQKSRNYAKRQLTWFHKNQKVHWLYVDQQDWPQLLEKAAGMTREFLRGEEL